MEIHTEQYDLNILIDIGWSEASGKRGVGEQQTLGTEAVIVIFELERWNSDIVVWRERIGWLRHCQIREAGRRHHRDRWHPRPLFVYRIVEREKRCSILPATVGVAVDLEATSVRRETGKVGMAGAAGLAGLPGKARQSSGRSRKLNHQRQNHEEQDRQG